jgi:hypothetical protein
MIKIQNASKKTYGGLGTVQEVYHPNDRVKIK